MKRAIFPGTFDPITIGHMDIITRALPLFDEIIIGIGRNAERTHLFDLDVRKEWIEEIFKNEPKIQVDHFVGLTVDFARFKKADFIIRGLRSPRDFEHEFQLSQVNRKVASDIETVYIMSSPEFTPISGKVVRELIIKGGPYKHFVPKEVDITGL